MVDIFEVVVTSSSDIFEGGDLLNVDFGWLLVGLPEREVVDEVFEFLTF
jgi:hypothetical protein